jgi:hypothetical protein
MRSERGGLRADQVLVGRVHIRCCGNGCLGFRPYGGSPFPNAEKVTQKACSCVRPARWGSGFLRSGIDPGAAPTVCFAAPPPAVFGCAKRSLRSHVRINPSTQPSDVARGSRSRAGELTLGLLSGEERGCLAFDLRCCCPSSERLPPAQPSPEGEGADFWAFQNLSSTRYCTSAYLYQTTRSVPSPSGRGLG